VRKVNSRKLSGETLDLLNKLDAVPSSRWAFWSRADDLFAMLAAIANRGEMLAVPSLLPIICNRNKKISQAAATAIQALLVDVQHLDLVYLDQYMRTLGPWSSGHRGGPGFGPHDVPRLSLLQHGSELSLGLASFHRDGFVREAATRALAGVTSGMELPFLLIRANDWIEQVREVATQALRERADREYVPHLVRNLPLIARLRKAGRRDHAPLVQALEDIVAGEAAFRDLIAAIGGSDRHLRRAGISVAIARGKVSVCLNSLASADAMVRLRSAILLFEKLPLIDGCPLADELAGDGFSAVRREALRYAIERCSHRLHERITGAMCDRSVSVRHVGIFYARNKLDLDAAVFYRAALESGSHQDIAPCIAGLGDTGTIEDVSMLRPLVGHRLPRVQRAALQAIAALGFDGNEDVFFTALASPQPGVSRKARELLVKVPLRGECPAIERAMLDSAYAHVRNNALSVLASTGKWSGLRYILLALQRNDSPLNEIAARSVSRWIHDHNRSLIQPQADDVPRIESLLEVLRNKLPENQHAALTTIMKSF
jgi:HEAT repeat protein